MLKEVIPVRSKNKNIFRRSNYWQTWSRILFHDEGGRGMLRYRERYEIPNHIKTIEIGLTPINGFRGTWEQQKIQEVRIYMHCTDIGDGRDLHAKVPVNIQEEMYANMDPRTVELLLHADFLPYLDFDKDRGGVVTFKDLVKEPLSLRDYFHSSSWCEGGPGIDIDDAAEDHKQYLVEFNNKLELLIPAV